MAPEVGRTVQEALARYYLRHGLPRDGGESDRWFRVRIGPIALPLPNPPGRRRAVFYHDLNHVLTGYDTAFSRGEMVIASYELASGCGRHWIAWGINLFMFLLGLLVRPRSMYGAFVRGRRAASVYEIADRESLRRMTVDELREALGIPTGVPRGSRGDRVRFAAWVAVGTGLLASGFLALWLVAG